MGIPMADPFWCLVGIMQYCKTIILQLKINKYVKKCEKGTRSEVSVISSLKGCASP